MLHTENSRQDRAGDDSSVSESHSENVGSDRSRGMGFVPDEHCMRTWRSDSG